MDHPEDVTASGSQNATELRPPEGMGWLGWFIPLVLIGGALAYWLNQSSNEGSHQAEAATKVEGGARH